MKNLAITCLVLALSFFVAHSAMAITEQATRNEVLSQCELAAKMIREKGVEAAVTAIADKEGPFVWKNTYVFLMNTDCKMLAHPIKPELTRKESLLEVKDSNGKPIMAEFVNIAKADGKGWVDYVWPKPGEAESSPKSTYIYKVPGTDYFVGAGIYR